MMWRLREVTEDDAQQFATWRYPEPYSLYDAGPEDAARYLDPANGYLAVADDDGQLVARCCFGPDARVPGGIYGHDAVDIGAGLRPELTGQGHGATLLDLAIDEARRRAPGKPLRVTIAAFNERAQHLARKAGFTEIEVFASPSGREFVVYMRANDTTWRPRDHGSRSVTTDGRPTPGGPRGYR